MPGTTPNLGLRYPVATDAPDGAGAFFQLASDIEDRFGRAATQVSSLAAGTRYGQRAIVGSVEYRWNGAAWKAWESDWATYVPTNLNGISVGTGGNAAAVFQYRYSAGEVEVKWNLVLGTSGSGSAFVNGDISFTLPAQTSQVQYYDDLGQVRFIKSGGNPAPAGHVGVNGTIAFVRPDIVSGSNVVEGVASSTVPFTWGAGDACVGRLRYTPA